MIGGNIPNIQFQTFYVSKEKSNCPNIPEVIRIGKKFLELGLSENINETVVSLRYGKRVLINAEGVTFGELKQEDFLEIVDYDPLKKVLLTMGPKEPGIDTSVHWMIHYARNEVNAIVQLNDNTLAEKLFKKLPVTEKGYPVGSLELAKEILKVLRDSKSVIIKNQGVLFVGGSIREVEDLILKTLEELT